MIEHIRYTLAWGFAGGWEWIVILVVALLIFGKRLPDIARSVGKSLTEFKKGINEAKEVKDDLEKDVKELKDDIVNEVNEAKDAAGLSKEETGD